MENVKLFTLVSQINELPAFPQVAYKIISEIDKEETDAKKLTEIILFDTSLTLKVINIANSAYYAPRSQIQNVTHAIQYIGFNTIKSIAYTTALQSVKSADKNNLLVSKFHEKAIVSAFIARQIINKINFFRKSMHNQEDFYIYALFHDIGEIVISVFYPDLMKKIMEGVLQGADIKDVEGKLKHSQIGMMLMRKWNLPESYAMACSKHHVLDQDKLGDDQLLFVNDVITVADAIAHELGYNPTYNTTVDVEKSIFRIGLRENDVFSEEGILGETESNIESQLTFLS